MVVIKRHHCGMAETAPLCITQHTVKSGATAVTDVGAVVVVEVVGTGLDDLCSEPRCQPLHLQVGEDGVVVP